MPATEPIPLPPAQAPRVDGWVAARRTLGMNPSAIRELLKLTEQPGITSLAGGLPSPQVFPIEAFAQASARVLREQSHAALQYSASEGYGPLREWIAQTLAARGMHVDAAQVLVTTGSQQALSLIGTVLIDAGSSVAVESPTYLGALQAFAPFEPRWHELACDEHGPLPRAVQEAPPVRFAYLQPNFQNPSGRQMPAPRRRQIVDAAARCGVPLVEDDPYGDLWYDAPPPPALSALAATAGAPALYVGSLSKVLAPGLRLGYIVAPASLHARLLQAKQAADLHSPSLNQRIAYEVVKDGLLDTHLAAVRARYRGHRDAMAAALARWMPPGTQWSTPAGGMFFWVRLPAPLDASRCLPDALKAGVAYVPGAPFFAGPPDARTLRLSFVTVAPEVIDDAVRRLGEVCARHLERQAA